MRAAALAGRSGRVAWTQDWQTIATHAAPRDLAIEQQLRLGESASGALVVQHAAAWHLDAQKEALQGARRSVLARKTSRLDTRTEEGAHNALLVLRFLHDLEGRLEALHTPIDEAPVTEEAASGAGCAWSAMELFCRPWVVARGKGEELLKLEEFVPAPLRALCAICSPWGVPLGALAAWVTVQSPEAFARLHLRRIAGPKLRPWRVSLDSGYRVEAGGLGIEALADAAASGQGVLELVRGAAPPQLFGRKASGLIK